jgi:hypothetical protein
VAEVRDQTTHVLPFRGWIRKLTGAAKHDRAVQAAIRSGGVRRGYLKGRGHADELRAARGAQLVRPGAVARTGAARHQAAAESALAGVFSAVGQLPGLDPRADRLPSNTPPGPPGRASAEKAMIGVPALGPPRRGCAGRPGRRPGAACAGPSGWRRTGGSAAAAATPSSPSDGLGDLGSHGGQDGVDQLAVGRIVVDDQHPAGGRQRRDGGFLDGDPASACAVEGATTSKLKQAPCPAR